MRAASDDLIELLVAGAEPVRRLPSPARRMARWLLFAFVLLAVFAAGHPFRYDILHCVQQPLWIALCGAALATAVLAAAAAFTLSIPGRSKYWALLPVPSLLVWVLVIGMRTSWVGAEVDALGVAGVADAIGTVVLLGIPLAVISAVMLRHAAGLAQRSVPTMAGLAIAGVAGTALSLFHPLHATVWLVASSAGVAALFLIAGSLVGPKLLAWAAR